jgi:hypothetical protein
MATLDRWHSFLSTPKTMVFPQLELKGYDHAPLIVVGSGEITMPSPSQFGFTLTGTPDDVPYAFEQIRKQRANPYDALARFRLVGTDAEAVQWMGGYTTPSFEVGPDWVFNGEIGSLSVNDKGDAVSREAGAELVFSIPPEHPMAFAIARFTVLDHSSGRRLRKHTMEVLGSSIRFTYDASAQTLAIVATQSPGLSPPYAEKWLSEPLRILFGQPVYPRLVARNFGDGSAFVSIRPSPPLVRGATWAALWKGEDLTQDKITFWADYAQLLTFIACARDETGNPNFEPHKITRLYEEIVRAARGSRWVWALTFASSIEALALMLTPKGTKPTEAEASAIAGLVKHINGWDGDAGLKRAAISAVHRTAETTTTRSLRKLVGRGVITEPQLSAWQKIRNSVRRFGEIRSRARQRCRSSRRAERRCCYICCEIWKLHA